MISTIACGAVVDVRVDPAYHARRRIDAVSGQEPRLALGRTTLTSMIVDAAAAVVAG